MSNINDFIGRCRENITERLPRPCLSDIDATEFPDPLKEFIAQAKAAGCTVVRTGGKEDTDRIIRETYPDAKTIASALSYVKSATVNPDDIDDPRKLNGTDVGVVEGKFGVAENGAVWLPQEVKERAVEFISENLVIIMPEDQVVSNMHQAAGLISVPDYGYGVFIAGPSKTADIAQVLVMGAQAARSLTLILVSNL